MPSRWIKVAAWAVNLWALGSCDRTADIPMVLLARAGAERPRIVLSSPSTLTPLAPVDSPIFVEFNTDMDETATTSAFSFSGNSLPAGRAVWWGRRLQWALTGPLTAGESYSMSVGASARSKSGYTADVDTLVRFTAGSGSTGPRITSTIPANSAQGLPLDTVVRISFSHTMDPASAQASFSLSPSTAGSITWESNNTTLIFTPLFPLTSGTTYTASVGTSARDSDGIPLDVPFTLTFQAGNDLERPSVLDIRESGTPLPVSDHQAGVSKDSLLSVRFSEPMDYQSAQTAVWLSKAADGAGVAALLFWNPLFTELTIHPSEPLEPLTDYRLTVSTAAKDLAGNSLSAPYNLVFRVDDTRGAGNSRYLSPLSVSKTLPTPVEDFLPLDSVTTYRTTSATGSVVLELVFSHALEPGSVADNISISKILGTSPGYGNITAIQFADAPNANQKVILTVGNLGLSNEYELRMNGGRSGIKSARLLSESGTWLEKDQSVFFRVFR